MGSGDSLVTEGIKFIVGKIHEEISLKEFIEKYLENYYSKHKQVKTFLHGGKNLNFEDIYYPLSIRSEYSPEERIIKNATDLFSIDVHDHITIIGDAGSGKSTFVKNMFMDVIKKKKGIPFLIELRQLKDHDSIADYISKVIVNNEATYNALTKKFEEGGWVFFLDGFDELQEKSKSKLLSTFIDLYPKNKFILTSRPSSDAEKLERFENYELLSLTDEDVISFAKKQLKFIDEYENIEANLLSSLKNGLESDNIKEFLANPLLLSIYILTFQKSPDIPKSKNLFYRRVLDALVYQHDVETKPGFVRSKNCNLDQGDLEKVLKKFSYLTYMQNTYAWNHQNIQSNLDAVKKSLSLEFQSSDLIKDMTSAYALWTEDEGEYAFSHRSFQEYFTCNYIKESKKNKEIYEILIKQLDKKISRGEIHNLVSLLEEIDEESFIENFKLPLFKKTNEVLQENTEKFLREHIVSLYSFGTPKLILKDYKSCTDIIDNVHGLGETSKFGLQSFIVGMDMGMRMDMGMNMGLGLGMGLGMRMDMKMDMRMDVDMDMDMGMSMGMDMGMDMGMRMDTGMKMDLRMGKKEVEQEVKRIIEKENIDEKVISELAISLCKIILEKEQDRKKLNRDLLNNKVCYLGFLSAYTHHIEHIERYPFVDGFHLLVLFAISTFLKDSSERLIDFVETNKNEFISMDNLSEDIFSDIEQSIKPKYEQYKKFIEDEIKELEEKIYRYTNNNNDDLALL